MGFARHFNLLKNEHLWSKETYLALFNQVCPHVCKLFNHETLVFPCVNTFTWSKACVLQQQASKQTKNSKAPLWATLFRDQWMPNASVWILQATSVARQVQRAGTAVGVSCLSWLTQNCGLARTWWPLSAQCFWPPYSWGSLAKSALFCVSQRYLIYTKDLQIFF